MATNTDLNDDELDDVPGASISSNKRSSETVESMALRQAGLNRTIERLKKERDAAIADKNARDDAAAEELRELRAQVRDLNKAANDAKKLADDAVTAKSSLEAQLNKATTRDKTAKMIAENELFKPLIPDLLAGDLKMREDFENDDAFVAYLERQAKKVQPVTASKSDQPEPERKPTLEERLRGATPSSSVRVVEGHKAKRDPIDISEEMMLYAPDSDEYITLYNELNEATTAA